jgi:hypothetical protein
MRLVVGIRTDFPLWREFWFDFGFREWAHDQKYKDRWPSVNDTVNAKKKLVENVEVRTAGGTRCCQLPKRR